MHKQTISLFKDQNHKQWLMAKASGSMNHYTKIVVTAQKIPSKAFTRLSFETISTENWLPFGIGILSKTHQLNCSFRKSKMIGRGPKSFTFGTSNFCLIPLIPHIFIICRFSVNVMWCFHKLWVESSIKTSYCLCFNKLQRKFQPDINIWANEPCLTNNHTPFAPRLFCTKPLDKTTFFIPI